MRFWSVRDSERYPWEFLIFSPSGTNICLTLVYLPGRITVSPPPPIPLPDAAEQGDPQGLPFRTGSHV